MNQRMWELQKEWRGPFSWSRKRRVRLNGDSNQIVSAVQGPGCHCSEDCWCWRKWGLGSLDSRWEGCGVVLRALLHKYVIFMKVLLSNRESAGAIFQTHMASLLMLYFSQLFQIYLIKSTLSLMIECFFCSFIISLIWARNLSLLWVSLIIPHFHSELFSVQLNVSAQLAWWLWAALLLWLSVLPVTHQVVHCEISSFSCFWKFILLFRLCMVFCRRQ
jgi:hypothetical protein